MPVKSTTHSAGGRCRKHCVCVCVCLTTQNDLEKGIMSLVQNNTVTFLKRSQNKATVCMMPSTRVNRQCNVNERKFLGDVLNQIVTSKRGEKAHLGEVEERGRG